MAGPPTKPMITLNPGRCVAAFFPRAVFAALVAFAVTAITRAQLAPKPAAASTNPAGETIQLSAFEVRSTADNSYGALDSNSLAAFRMELAKAPATAEVFTQAFMDDIAASSIEEVLTGYAGTVATDFSNFYETQIKGSVSYRRGKFGGNVGAIRNGRVFRQYDGIAASATAPAVGGIRYYPPNTTVDFNLDYTVTKWAKLFISGRNLTNAQKIRYRVVDGAPSWSNFQIANNLGATYTAGVTGSF